MSMVKPFPDCIRELWSLIDGDKVLSLGYEQVMSCLRLLKKSAKQWIQDSEPQSDDHKNALLSHAAVDEVLETLSGTYAKSYSKRQIVENLVSFN